MMSRPCCLSVDAGMLGACEQAAFAGLPDGCSDLPTRAVAGCLPATQAERWSRPNSYEGAWHAMRQLRCPWAKSRVVSCLGKYHCHHVSSVACPRNTMQISSLRLQVHRRQHLAQCPTCGLSEDHLNHSLLLKALIRSQCSCLWPVVGLRHDLTPARWLV